MPIPGLYFTVQEGENIEKTLWRALRRVDGHRLLILTYLARRSEQGDPYVHQGELKCKFPPDHEYDIFGKICELEVDNKFASTEKDWRAVIVPKLAPKSKRR